MTKCIQTQNIKLHVICDGYLLQVKDIIKKIKKTPHFFLKILQGVGVRACPQTRHMVNIF